MKSDSSTFYSEKEFQSRLAREIVGAVHSPAVFPRALPKAVLLGGQSGAGKTALHDVLRKVFCGNMVLINGDEYRASHPRFHEFQKQYGGKAVDYTAPWASRMTEAMIDKLSELKYNLVIEGTLRTMEVPLATAQLLKGRGYGVSLAIMAVKPEISWISCQLRYEQMRESGTTPRATDKAHHDKIVAAIVENVAVLEQSGLFDTILLYNRSLQCIYSGEETLKSASRTLKDTLYDPWTVEEKKHYKALKTKLETLQRK